MIQHAKNTSLQLDLSTIYKFEPVRKTELN